MQKHGILAQLALTTAMIVLPAVLALPAAAQGPGPNQMRGQYGSNQNIAQIDQHLNHMIRHLEHDRRDYGGHKAKAIKLLQQAEEQLNKAQQYAAAHGY